MKSCIHEYTSGLTGYYDLFKDRLMTPLRDDFGVLVAYTGRRLDGKSEVRHYNNETTALFQKSKFVYNFYKAKKELYSLKKVYLMEGHGDVLALNDLGIMNACASLSASLSIDQLKKFKPYSPTLCFIPDADTGMKDVDGIQFHKGEAFAIKNAILAMEQGFDVSVRLIPQSEDEKRDVNSYVKTKEIWDSLYEESFVIWYASKIIDMEASVNDIISTMMKICRLLQFIENDAIRTALFNRLKKQYKDKDNWNTAFEKAKEEKEEQKMDEIIRKSSINTRKFHILEIGNSYYFLKDLKKDGDRKIITNFKMTPLYLIKTDAGSKRIVELTNEKGEVAVVEFLSKEISRYDLFVDKVTSIGDYNVLASKDEYNISLRSMIMSLVMPLEYLEVLGQNKEGCFFALANGIGDKNGWHEADRETKILKYEGKNYYFPDSNDRRNRMRYDVSEKQVSSDEYFQLIVNRFGENGMISLAYILATLNRDVITKATRFFPLLYFYGNTGSGKTELSVTLSKFFRNEPGMMNMTSASDFSLGHAMTEMNNGLTIIEEFNEEIGREKSEMFKGTYDLTGRYVRDDINGMRKEYKTNTGVLMSGNHIPDYDRALLTRTIFLEFFTIGHSNEGRKEMDRLKKIREQGVMAITIELQKYRSDFEKHFRNAWDEAIATIKLQEDIDKVEERIQECWAVAYATILCYRKCGVQLPFSSKALLNASILGMFSQHDVLKTSDIETMFWKALSAAYKKGRLVEGSHFIIKNIGKGAKFSKNRKRFSVTEEDGVTEYIMLELESCIEIANAQRIKRREQPLRDNAIMRFLENANEHVGKTVAPIRFAILDDNNRPVKRSFVNQQSKKRCIRQEYIMDRAVTFDYGMVRNKYGIDFSTDYVIVEEEKPMEDDSQDIDSKDDNIP